MSWLRCLIIALGVMLFAQVAQAREIASFTDNQGTLHITNIKPKTQGVQDNPLDLKGPLGPSALPAKSQNLSSAIKPTPEVLTPDCKAEAAPARPLQAEPRPHTMLSQAEQEGVMPVTRQPGGQDKMGVAPGVASLQRVSWSPPPPANPVLRGKIVSYRNRHGVIHITNEPLEDGSPTAPAAPAVAAVQRQVSSPGAANLTVQTVSCPELGLEVVAYLKEKLQGFLTVPPGNAVHRYRDHQGVWRIFTQPPPEPQVSPSQLASRASLTVPAVAHAPPPGQTLPPVAGRPGFSGPTIRPSDSGVIARRDPRGVMHIFNCAASGLRTDPASPVNFLGKLSPPLQACIIEAAQLYQLPVPLILALIRNESNFAAQAVSPKGAMGLMQLMPETAASLGVKEPFDPRENILAGCRYFRFLLDYFQGSIPLALAGYNAGYRRVVTSGCQVPAIKETQDFVTQVMGLYYLLEKQVSGL